MRIAAGLILVASVAACSDAGTSSGGEGDADGGASSSSSSSGASGSSSGGAGDGGCLVSSEPYRSGAVVASASRGAGGEAAWTATGDALKADGASASVSLDGSAESEELRVTKFGLGVPSGAKIVGVQVELKRQAEGAIYDGALSLIVPGKAPGQRNYTPPWPKSIIGTHVYGSPTELWGAALTAEDLNQDGFGVALWVKKGPDGTPAKAMVDALRVAVHYCP